MSTMLYSVENSVDEQKDNSADIGFLEQNFAQIPAKGKILLKNHLQNLVSLQNTMTGAVSVDNAQLSAKDK